MESALAIAFVTLFVAGVVTFVIHLPPDAGRRRDDDDDRPHQGWDE